jgi:hypothetical protein
MSHPDISATISLGGPLPVIADRYFDPNGIQTVTVNLPGVLEGGRTITINSRPPQGADGDDEMADSDLLGRVGRLETNVSAMTADVASMKEKLTHMPTKLWIAGWGLLGLVATVGVLWRIVAALLDSQGAHIAAEVMKAASK